MKKKQYKKLNKNSNRTKVQGIFKVPTGNKSQQSCEALNPVATNKKIKRKSKSHAKARETKNLIDKKMNFSEIMEKRPEAAEILMNQGMHCIGCSMAMYETLEQGAIMHGLNPDKLVKKLNKKIKKKKK